MFGFFFRVIRPVYLFASNNARDEWDILRQVGCFQSDFVDVIDEGLAIDWPCRLLVALVVDTLTGRQESILNECKPLLDSFQNTRPK